MRVVSQKKHRRPVRHAPAHGTKSVKNNPKSVIDAFPRGATLVKFKPLTADELTRLTEKMIAEKDPEKIRQIKEQIMEGFYGEKLVPV